tara:strand:+ start:1505 stop:1636 length:132 start_codon:yes stop_codon:yes gene_type:complete
MTGLLLTNLTTTAMSAMMTLTCMPVIESLQSLNASLVPASTAV